ncbi:ubiquitin-conjugating enzyme/RWD-like protein [Mycena epipterygia]|nr:ubiquitin-conjugating enzyme/RWD-like protein [Mycena epipterygia]
MHSDTSNGACKKRKRSGSEVSESERTSAIIRRSIALLAAIPKLPTASFSPLLNTLNEAYQSALSTEALATKPSQQQFEDWNWELSPEQIAGLTEEERTIWKDLLVCRESLRRADIKLHPVKWTMPVVDLRQWEAHIPGVKNTPWEGGVYSLQVSFTPGFPDYVPKFCFVRPLFHPNAYPSGTWGYTHLEQDTVPTGRHQSNKTWLKTRQEDPMRFATVMRAIQQGLNEPNINNPSQSDAYTLCKNDPEAYEVKIRDQTEAWRPDPHTGLNGRPILQPIKQES